MRDKLTIRNKKQRTETQVLLAQYFTPQPIADFMSSMFRKSSQRKVSILDPGAGEGILGISLLKSLNAKNSVSTFIELDEPTFQRLKMNVSALFHNEEVNLINDDFISAGLKLEEQKQTFTHIILNPPYFKLRVDSPSSKLLRRNGIQITNIYAAFIWLSARLLETNGQLVAIIPRSFCNGPYFLSFRKYITSNFSIDGIHIFNSRNKAFSSDNVLQENVIIHFSRRQQGSKIKLTYSTDQQFSDIEEKTVPIDVVLEPNDTTKTIHIPSYSQSESLSGLLKGTLQDLGISVSTGPIVDFRLKDQIHSVATKTTVPLLYPSHMAGHLISWPSEKFNKDGQHYQPQKESKIPLPLGSISEVKLDRNLLPLDGYYVIVRRFSSKEEKRRIFASVVGPEDFKSTHITFENHLNYFHIQKHGMKKDLAYGICAYLNSSILDEHFRKVSGHTQVNVSDLKRMPYPSLTQLQKLGRAMTAIDSLIDDIVTKEIIGKIK